MTPAEAFVGTSAVVVGLVAVRGDVPTARRARMRRCPASTSDPRRLPAWVGQLLVASGVAADPERVWATLCWAGPASVLAVLFAAGPLPAVVLAVVAASTPPALGRILRRRILDRRDAQLPASLERLASALRAGSAPTAAFVELAEAAPEPLRVELRVAAAEIEHGAPMSAAVERWAARPDASPAVRLAAAALGLSVEAGGEVARSMDRVAATVRERRELQAEVHALATQARASAGVLCLAPIGFTALVSTIEPGMVQFLLTTPIGILCLVSGLALEVAGGVWMARIVAGAT